MTGHTPNFFRPPAAAPAGAKRRLAKMTETFVAEVGVLLLVFPILDKLISTGQLSVRYVMYSVSGGLLFYAAAAFLAIYTGD